MASGTTSRQLRGQPNLRKCWGLALALVLMSADIWAESGAWTQKASEPFQGGAASVVKGKIYVMGGSGNAPGIADLAYNQVYDPTTDKWEAKKALPTPRGILTSAVVNDTIYVIGGGYPTATGVVEAYDPATDTWTTKTSMPAPRIGMAAAVVNGIIYIMGGNYNERDCQAYNPRTNAWSVKSPMPVGGGGWVHSATAYNGVIYVFGGSTYSPWAPLKTVFAYDPQTDTWTKKKDMPTARFAVGTYLVDGRIYVLGGSLGENNSLATVEVYDPAFDTWKTLANMPVCLMMFGSATVNGRIYVFGGTQDWSTVKTDVWEFDPLGQWPATVAVEQREALPTCFALGQNYPNPFNPSTTIKYELTKSSAVKLSVYDMLGREVSVLVNERRNAGVHEVKFNGSNLASGVYLYRIQAGDFVSTKKLVLLR
jgi:N-acetylneuraminic acid mutarotase